LFKAVEGTERATRKDCPCLRLKQQ
jgi:hypothetical protein